VKIYFIYRYLRFFDSIDFAQDDIAAHPKDDTAKVDNYYYLMFATTY